MATVLPQCIFCITILFVQTISLKLPASLENALAQESARRGVSKSEVIRECLAEMLSRESRSKKKRTCYDLSRNLAGSLRGPVDIASNPKYLDDLGQ